MKITQVRLGRISTPLRVPFKTALRTVNSVEDVIVELHTDTGAVGYGEAPPTGVITGDTTGAILGAIQDHIAPALLGRDLDEFEDLTAAVQKALVHNTSAKAAVDMALWIMQTGAADLVNIKLMKCGGITNALRIAAAAEVYGVECMIGCMLEAKISVNAAVELACAKKIITKIDLDGPVLCSEDHILGGAVFDEKNITVSDAPGMGIQGFVPGKVSYLD